MYKNCKAGCPCASFSCRDAIAKALYSVLFDWLLEQINDWLSPTEMDSTVGIVDIYGFEVGTPGSDPDPVDSPVACLGCDITAPLCLCRTWE